MIAEAGAMLWMEQGITFETKMGDGTEPEKGFLGKLAGGAKRMVAGESLFMTHFTNRGGGNQKVACAAPCPGTIVPLDLGQLPRTSGGGGSSAGENILGNIFER